MIGYRNICLIVMVLIFALNACSENEGIEHSSPKFESSIPLNNATDVSVKTSIEVIFDEVVTLSANHGITINNKPADVQVSFTKLIFTAALEAQTSYTILIPKGAIINTFGVALETAIELLFTTKDAPIINEDAMAFVASMGVGWSLGNTLDSKGTDETVWGNPITTKAMIDMVKAKGFNTIRVPVTWQYHMGDDPEYLIENDWLNRVEEVVNYGLDNGMFVIINIHHDEEWIIPTYQNLSSVKNQLAKVWSQIATHFKSYDEHLLFETLNEPRLKNSSAEWTGGTSEGRDCINQFHQAAIEAIRATGENNSNRYVMISSYAASSTLTAINGLELPSSENLIVSIHNYYPYELCLGENGKDWGSDNDKNALDAEFDRLVDAFISNGIPVVLGEWGNLNHDNPEDRIRHAAYYSEGCIKRGICPIWWDNGQKQDFGLLDRRNLQWYFPQIADAIVGALE